MTNIELAEYGTDDYELHVATFTTSKDYPPNTVGYVIVNRKTRVVEAEGSVLGAALMAVKQYQHVLDQARLAYLPASNDDDAGEISFH